MSITCRDSTDQSGFKTFDVSVDPNGTTQSSNGCYSGDGGEHWFTADGVESNHLRWDGPSPTPTVGAAGHATLAQGAKAAFGYWYVVTLADFPPMQPVAVVCRDSVTPDGFKTLTLVTDSAGRASTAQACYSGDGPEHWITANNLASNRVVWTQSPPPTTRVTDPVYPGKVTLSQGSAAVYGYWYVVTLRGYRPNSLVQVICRDSVDPGGFKTFSMKVSSSGAATDTRACYSADGPDHWVTANGVPSNKVRWVPPSPKGMVSLGEGEAAPFGHWYAVRLDQFAPNSSVQVICRDSVDPGGFKTFAMAVDGSGKASTAMACYSGDGPDHWVTANGIASNHVSW